MAEKNLETELEQLKKDFTQLQKDIKDLGTATSSTASDAASVAREHLEQETQKLLASLRDGADSATSQGKNAMRQAENQVNDNPLSTLLGSFGVGFVIGWLLSRK